MGINFKISITEYICLNALVNSMTNENYVQGTLLREFAQ